MRNHQYCQAIDDSDYKDVEIGEIEYNGRGG